MVLHCLICKSSNISEVVEHNKRYYYCQSCQKLYERARDMRYGKDIMISSEYGIQHVCIAARIQNDGLTLMLKRRSFPFGYDFPAGHVEYNETPQEAMQREVLEETGLKVKKQKLIFSGVLPYNKCRYGADSHYYYFYQSTVEPGTAFLSPESETIGWYSDQEIEALNLVDSAQFLLNCVKDHE